MNDAISRGALIQMRRVAWIDGLITPFVRIADIYNAPALDVAPVVHAHWIKTLGSDGFVSALRCSKCGNAENSTYVPGNFCWFCGARMDGEADD